MIVQDLRCGAIDTTIILITELLEIRKRKEEELDFYHKELEMTRLIIDLIENEKIRTK